MRKVIQTSVAGIAGAAFAGSLLFSGAGTAAGQTRPESGPAAQSEVGAKAADCVGTSFSGTLEVNKSICNNGYTVTMQDNGDLVLRNSVGSPCYASGTRAPGDASATFVQNIFGVPYVEINSVSQGEIGMITGAHGLTEFGTNASVNSAGEFWIGFKRIGFC